MWLCFELVNIDVHLDIVLWSVAKLQPHADQGIRSMQLKGSFEASSLPSLLQMLVNDAKTGELRLTEGPKEVTIFLKQGNAIYAKGNQMETRLGSLLRSKGVITAQQLQECLVKASETKQAVGKVLVASGYITQEILKKVIHKQAEDVIYNLFLWDKGDFEYNDFDKAPDGIMETRLEIMGIILEATRRIDEMSVLKKHIENEQVIFKIGEKFGDKEKLKFNAIEWRFLSLIDGTRTVRQLINESGYEDFAVYKVLHSLLSFKLIERVEDDKASSSLSSLVGLYADILSEIVKGLEMELGSWAYMLEPPPNGPDLSGKTGERHDLRMENVRRWIRLYIDRLKPVAAAGEKNLFSMYHPDIPVEIFTHAVLEALKDISDPAKAQDFLAERLNGFVDNLLSGLHSAIGVPSAQDLLKEVLRALRYMGRYQKNLADKADLLKNLENMVKQRDRALWNENGGKKDGSKFLMVSILPPAVLEASPVVLPAGIVEDDQDDDSVLDAAPVQMDPDELPDLEAAEELPDLEDIEELPDLEDAELSVVGDMEILDEGELPDQAESEGPDEPSPRQGRTAHSGRGLPDDDDPIAKAAAELEQLADMDLLTEDDGVISADDLEVLPDLDDDSVFDGGDDFDSLPDLDSDGDFTIESDSERKRKPLVGIEAPGLEEALEREGKKPPAKVIAKKF